MQLKICLGENVLVWAWYYRCPKSGQYVYPKTLEQGFVPFDWFKVSLKSAI